MEETDFEISYFHNFPTSVTLTLDRVLRHNVMYHSSTSSTNISNLIQIGKKLSMSHVSTDIESRFIRLTRSRPNQTVNEK